MYTKKTVERVLHLCVPGTTTRDVARLVGIPERTVAHWRHGDRHRERPPDPCPRVSTEMGREYAYLLGAYLGDGHITAAQRTHCLWIYCADNWPGVMTEVRQAMGAVMTGTSVSAVQRSGCTAIKSFSKHWPCFFPQHGKGMKHTRPIVLEPWQQEIVDAQPGPFLRGLFHSDGCRITNWTSRTVAGVPKRYEYPRWFFSNESADILELCTASLDRLGIAHRRPRYNAISVARREAVAVMDEVVGPKT